MSYVWCRNNVINKSWHESEEQDGVSTAQTSIDYGGDRGHDDIQLSCQKGLSGRRARTKENNVRVKSVFFHESFFMGNPERQVSGCESCPSDPKPFLRNSDVRAACKQCRRKNRC